MAKLRDCDGCGKIRRDVVSCGKDDNGEADAPDLCFICRKEMSRNRFYSNKLNKYMDYGYFLHDQF